MVSGINPGNNVGRSVYHSGTVGAALTARNGGTTGIAVSQRTDFAQFLGQGEPVEQLWQTAATVTGSVVAGVIESPPERPVAINLNVDNIPLEEVKGWKRAEVISAPFAGTTALNLTPTEADPERFEIKMNWGSGKRPDPLPGSDLAAVVDGYVAVSYLTELSEDPSLTSPGVEAQLSTLIGNA